MRKKLTKTGTKSDYTTGNLLDFAYFKKHYELIPIDLSEQTKLKNHNRLILLVSFQIYLE